MTLLKHDEVLLKLNMTKPALQHLRRREDSFPQPIRLTQKVLRWDEAEIDNWISAKKESDDGKNSRIGRRITD